MGRFRAIVSTEDGLRVRSPAERAQPHPGGENGRTRRGRRGLRRL